LKFVDGRDEPGHDDRASKGIDAVTIANEALSKSSGSSPADLIPLLESVAEAANGLRDRAREGVGGKVGQGGTIDSDALEREQHAGLPGSPPMPRR
jgi:hypothetical protein